MTDEFISCGEIARFKFYKPGRRAGFVCENHIHSVVTNASVFNRYRMVYERYHGIDKQCCVRIKLRKVKENDSD